jgi:threonine dehydratase
MDNMSLPTAAGIREALDRIRPYMPVSPLVRADVLSDILDRDIYFKIETTSPIGSFKLRGALNCLLAGGADARVVVSSSTGNHGQGVAFAARELGKPCTIFLPDNPNPEKRRKIELLGAEVITHGRDIDVAKQAAQTFARDKGGLFIDDGEDVLVMEGAGTIGHEVGEALQDIDAIVLPTGGGNLVSGTAVGIKAHQPGVNVIAVQSEAAAAMHASFHARAPVEREVLTAAECLAQGVPPVLALRAMLEFVDDSVAVTDDDLFAAAHALALYGNVLAESGSAGGLAALVRHPEAFVGARRIVLVVTGANVDAASLQRMIETPPIVSRR